MDHEHFGLTARPFQLTPDPHFWYATATHRKAMAYLSYGLAQGEGFVVVTGDIGAGKTTLVGHLLATIDPDQLHAIRLVSTAIEAADLLRLIATQLGVASAGLEKAELLLAIERGLHAVARTGRRTLLVVDEAQALPVSALEELRMLSNFQAGGHALLQIVLVGQPEFRERLHGSDRLEQLRQRVIAIHHLDPMTEDEIAPYIAHRLALVGWTGRPDFADDAGPALFRASEGVPRRLNLIAGRVMLQAALSQDALIDAAMVDAVRADMERDLPTASTPPAAAAAPAVPPPAPSLPAAPELQDDAVVERPAEPLAAVVSASQEPAHAEPLPLNIPAMPVPVGPGEYVAAEHAPSHDDGEPSVDRIALLEARIEEQDAALRRVLTLLVDWVEGDGGRTAELSRAHAA